MSVTISSMIPGTIIIQAISDVISEISSPLTGGGNITANYPTNIVDFRGFYSSNILILRVGIPRPKGISCGIFPEGLTQAMLVGIMLGGRLGVPSQTPPTYYY